MKKIKKTKKLPIDHEILALQKQLIDAHRYFATNKGSTQLKIKYNALRSKYELSKIKRYNLTAKKSSKPETVPDYMLFKIHD